MCACVLAVCICMAQRGNKVIIGHAGRALNYCQLSAKVSLFFFTFLVKVCAFVCVCVYIRFCILCRLLGCRSTVGCCRRCRRRPHQHYKDFFVYVCVCVGVCLLLQLQAYTALVTAAIALLPACCHRRTACFQTHSILHSFAAVFALNSLRFVTSRWFFFYLFCCVLLQHLPFTVARHLRFRRRWRAVTTVSAAVCGCAPLGVRLSASQQPLTSATLFCCCCSIFLLVRLPCVVSFHFVSFVCYSTSLACKANSFHFIALFFHSHFVIFTMQSHTHTHKHIHLYTVFTCSTFFQTLTSLMHFADLSCYSFLFLLQLFGVVVVVCLRSFRYFAQFSFRFHFIRYAILFS